MARMSSSKIKDKVICSRRLLPKWRRSSEVHMLLLDIGRTLSQSFKMPFSRQRWQKITSLASEASAPGPPVAWTAFRNDNVIGTSQKMPRPSTTGNMYSRAQPGICCLEVPLTEHIWLTPKPFQTFDSTCIHGNALTNSFGSSTKIIQHVAG